MELNRQLDRQAQNAAQRVQELTTRAQQAGRSTEQISIDNQLLRDARQAANEVEALRRAAQQASGQLGQLGNDLNDVADGAGDAGGNTGTNFLSGFADKLGDLASKTGPIAGSILGIAVLGVAAGAALAGAIRDGLNGELQRDIFQSQTGTTQAQAEKFARAAAEAYANVFGDSVEANLATAKLGLNYSFIDAGSTQLEAQKVIETLEGVAAVVGTESAEVARAMGGLINAGLVENFDEAADLITKASQAGLNRQDDLIDSLSEYATGWKNTGLSAQTALALIDQSMDLGVDNTDRAADAIREFGRRVTEEGDTIVATLNDIGLNGDEMYVAFKRGGDDAEDAFDKTFDAIRDIEDPVRRNTVAMALLGDTSGDFIDAFTQWDPSEAKRKFGEVEGAAQSAIAVMGDNAATSVEGAMRSISVASDGLKAALAEAFGPYIQDFADNISNNRAGVIGFFVEIGDTAFEVGKQVLGFASEAIRALAEFAGSASLAATGFLGMALNIADAADSIPFLGDALGIDDTKRTLADLTMQVAVGGQDIKRNMLAGADAIENRLIPGLEAAQTRFGELGGDMKVSAAFNDEIAKVNKSISEVGTTANGATMDLETFLGGLGEWEKAPADLARQMEGLTEKIREQNRTGLEAGATVEELTKQYHGNRDALIEQLMATGMTNEAALHYINSLGLVPELVETQIKQPGMPEAHYDLDILKGKVIDVPDEKSIHTYALTEEAVSSLEALGYKVEHLPDGTVKVTAPTDYAEGQMKAFLDRERAMTVWVDIKRRRAEAGVPEDFVGPTIQDVAPNANGSIRQRANGGFDHLADPIIKQGVGDGSFHQTPLGPVQAFEGETGWEAFIPGALSKRKRAEKILAEVARRFGFGLINFNDRANGARDQIISSLYGHTRGEAHKVFAGDPKSLTDQTDPTGWRALLGGDYSGKLSHFGIEEDSPFVDAVLSARNAIVNGDFDGRLSKYGIEEDSPIAAALLGLNQHFFKMADGGILDGDAAVAFAKSKDNLPYSYGGAGGENWDCSGYMSGIYNKLTGKSVRFTTDSDFAALGFVPGYDPDGFSIGTNNGSGMNGHMAGTLFGTNVESGSANGVQYGGPALGARDFPSVWHLPGASQGPSEEELNAAIDASLNDLNFATTPEEKKTAIARLRELDAQKSNSPSGGASGTTNSGVTLSTDGVTQVWVTNWPEGSGGAPKSTPISLSGGGGGGGSYIGGTPQIGGTTGQTWETPPMPQERLFEWAQQAGPELAEAWGIPKPGGFLGALLSPETAEAARQTADGVHQGMQQSWRPGVQIDNHITVSNEQEQGRRLMEQMSRWLAQFGGATP